MPFKIIAEDENLICTDFMFRKNKIVKIKYEDIGKLEGGIFEKRLNWLMRIHDRRNNLFIGFFQQLKGSKTLETIILNKINRQSLQFRQL